MALDYSVFSCFLSAVMDKLQRALVPMHYMNKEDDISCPSALSHLKRPDSSKMLAAYNFMLSCRFTLNFR